MPTFEILPGLPPYGPTPKLFSPDGKGAHREGLVVRFPDAACGPWVGNFQKGSTPTESRAMLHPNGRFVVVFVEGVGYAVNPDTMELVEVLGEDIIEVLTIPGTSDLLISFYGSISVSRLSATGWAWHSKRLALDEVSDLRIEGDWVTGVDAHPHSPFRQFRISLKTGKGDTFSFNILR